MENGTIVGNGRLGGTDSPRKSIDDEIGLKSFPWFVHPRLNLLGYVQGGVFPCYCDRVQIITKSSFGDWFLHFLIIKEANLLIVKGFRKNMSIRVADFVSDDKPFFDIRISH